MGTVQKPLRLHSYYVGRVILCRLVFTNAGFAFHFWRSP